MKFTLHRKDRLGESVLDSFNSLTDAISFAWKIAKQTTMRPVTLWIKIGGKTVWERKFE